MGLSGCFMVWDGELGWGVWVWLAFRRFELLGDQVLLGKWTDY